MKTNKFIIAALIFLTALTSCLDESPKYSLNSTTVFSNDVEAAMALNGCYTLSIQQFFTGQILFEILEGASGIGWSQVSSNDDDQFTSLSWLNSNSYTSGFWAAGYSIIAHCNAYIYGAKNGNLSASYKDQSVGEALFLRGLVYYYFGLMFEQAPIVLEATSKDNINNTAKSQAEVQAQAIADFEAAKLLLPEKVNGDPSKPCQLACDAYIAKLYYYTNRWDQALTHARNLVGKYTLESYSTLFAEDVRKTNEDIFVFNSSGTIANNNLGNRLSWLFSPQSWTPAGTNSWGRIAITKAFGDYHHSVYPNDTRFANTYFKDSILLRTGSYTFAYPLGIDACSPADRANPTMEELDQPVKWLNGNNNNPWRTYTTTQTQHNGWYGIKKHSDSKQEAVISRQNIRMLRYADILMMLADILKESEPTVALDYMNQVLTAARANGTQPENYTAADMTKEKIYYERLFQLVGEGHTFMETRRYGFDWFNEKIIVPHDNHHVTIAHSKLAGSPFFRDRLFKETMPLNRAEVMSFPIPQTELNTNPDILK